MVSNQNAKVSHFNQVKMELVNARNDKNVLQQKVREQDEKEKKWLNLVKISSAMPIHPPSFW